MRPALSTAVAASLVGATLLVAGVGAADRAVAVVERPATGHYQARGADGAYLSFFVRKRATGWRVENLQAFRRCGGSVRGLGSLMARPMPVAGGAFELPARLQPLFGIEGVFRTVRAATVRVGPSFGCGSSVLFRATRTNRGAVQPGEWTGTDATGARLSFRVDRFGRAMDDLMVSTEVTCSAGGFRLDDAPLIGRPIPVAAGRAFSAREADSGGFSVRAVGGRFTSAGVARGELRVVREADGRTCDSGLVAFTASPAR